MANRPYKPSVGSISHGTHRAPDLLEAFADELARIDSAAASAAIEAGEAYKHDNLIEEARAVLTLVHAGWRIEDDMAEAVSELVNDLQDALAEHAPAFCYFGTHPGDGSDFGFWPDMDSIDELPRVSDPSEADEHDECAFVNDHGNVTVYANGAVALEIV